MEDDYYSLIKWKLHNSKQLLMTVNLIKSELLHSGIFVLISCVDHSYCGDPAEASRLLGNNYVGIPEQKLYALFLFLLNKYSCKCVMFSSVPPGYLLPSKVPGWLLLAMPASAHWSAVISRDPSSTCGQSSYPCHTDPLKDCYRAKIHLWWEFFVFVSITTPIFLKIRLSIDTYLH